MRLPGLAVLGLLWACAGAAAAEDSDIYIELLWSKPPADALARQQTRQFVINGDHDHQICVAASGRSTDVGGLQLELLDAAGRQVSLHGDQDYRGAKRCYRADLGAGGVAGDWTVRVVLGDGRTGTATVRVDLRIEDSPHYLARSLPYVAGRPNHDASIPAGQWVGRLVWAMDVDPQGKVTHVEVEVAEGVGQRLRERAIAAGYMTVFPPDPARAGTPLRWRRSLEFAPQ